MDAEASGATRDPLVGKLVDGRFRLESRLGSGTVGTVYRARDEQGGRPLAIKVWHGASDTQTRGRFVREARALLTLKHPHIVEIYGVGRVDPRANAQDADDTPYVAMELLEGQTLEAALAGGRSLDPARAFHVTRQVLSAIAFAHERNVVHRDLKPENIFLARGADGREVAKLLDYGLAKFLGADDPTSGVDLTVTGMVMGTPLYMPPEQAAGAKVDVRVDVYAMGCILFEMLTGRLPYLGEDFGELIRAHVAAPLPKLTDVLTRVTPVPELDALLDRAMAKKPEERYPDAGAMLRALEAIPRPWLRPRVNARALANARRTRLIAASASLAVLAGVALWAITR